MADHPIIFSGPMVLALLDGRKTMTRRLAWRSPGPNHHFPLPLPTPWQRVKPGDRLWTREAHALLWPDEYPPKREQDYRVEFRAHTDGKCLPGEWPDDERENPDRPKWRPSIHMPRWASRITLIITATKIERLQDISEADAQAEGVRNEIALAWVDGLRAETYSTYSMAEAFKNLWNHLHGPDSWSANPECVCLTFSIHKQNIDRLAGERAA